MSISGRDLGIHQDCWQTTFYRAGNLWAYVRVFILVPCRRKHCLARFIVAAVLPRIRRSEGAVLLCLILTMSGMRLRAQTLEPISRFPQNDDRYQQLMKQIHDETLRAGKFFGQANAQLYASGHALSKDARFFQNGPSNDGWKPPARGGQPVNPSAPPPAKKRSLGDGVVLTTVRPAV